MDNNFTLLIGIGAQRSGTTWLASYLSSHPEVFMSPVKELHYFDGKTGISNWDKTIIKKFRYFVSNLQNDQFHDENYIKLCAYIYRIGMTHDKNLYKKYFTEFRNGKKIACEITPGYSTLSRVEFKEMATIHDSVKILFIMRNPVDRFWSQLRYRSSRKYKNHHEWFEKSLTDPRFILRTDYARTITELIQSIDKSNIQLMFYENLFTDQAISSLCSFLKINYKKADFSYCPNNPTISEKIKKINRKQIYDKFSHVYRFINDYFDGDIPSNWKNDIIEYEN